jgi:TRAP-type transport system small permease protein
MKSLERLVRALGQVELGLGIFLVLAMVVMIGVQVITRYFFDQPLAWVEELCTYAFIWTVFVGASCALRLNRHIAIEAFQLLLSARAKQWLELFIWLAIGLFLVLVIPQGYKIMQVEARSNSVSLPIDVPRMWFYSVPLTLACCSMLLTTVLGLLSSMQRLRAPRTPSLAPERTL